MPTIIKSTYKNFELAIRAHEAKPTKRYPERHFEPSASATIEDRDGQRKREWIIRIHYPQGFPDEASCLAYAEAEAKKFVDNYPA
jgi:hypothetical protein